MHYLDSMGVISEAPGVPPVPKSADGGEACGIASPLSASKGSYRGGIVDLHQAIRLRDVDSVRRLIDGGVDVNAPMRGTTPLSLAVNLGSAEMVNSLVASGANVNKLSRDHNDRLEPPLFTACRLGAEGLVKRLLDASADVNKTDFYNQSPLWIATRERRLDLVQLLLEHGALVHGTRAWSECPLYLATKYLGYKGRREIAKLLIRSGIDVNVADNKGRTPLYWALKNCDKEVSSILVSCGGRIPRMQWSAVDRELAIDLKLDHAFYQWLKSELSSPLPLQRLCLCAIRNHVSNMNRGSSILGHLSRLPLPTSLLNYITLEDHVYLPW